MTNPIMVCGCEGEPQYSLTRTIWRCEKHNSHQLMEDQVPSVPPIRSFTLTPIIDGGFELHYNWGNGTRVIRMAITPCGGYISDLKERLNDLANHGGEISLWIYPKSPKKVTCQLTEQQIKFLLEASATCAARVITVDNDNLRKATIKALNEAK